MMILHQTRSLGLRMQDTGVFRQASVAKSAQEQMLTNPEMMTDMLKKNLGGIVPQVRYFCAAAACCKLHHGSGCMLPRVVDHQLGSDPGSMEDGHD